MLYYYSSKYMWGPDIKVHIPSLLVPLSFSQHLYSSLSLSPKNPFTPCTHHNNLPACLLSQATPRSEAMHRSHVYSIFVAVFSFLSELTLPWGGKRRISVFRTHAYTCYKHALAASWYSISIILHWHVLQSHRVCVVYMCTNHFSLNLCTSVSQSVSVCMCWVGSVCMTAVYTWSVP